MRHGLWRVLYVTMNAARAVTATFARQRFTLTVAVNNVGTAAAR